MNTRGILNVVIVIAVVGLVSAVACLKSDCKPFAADRAAAGKPMPRMVDLGAGKCKTCIEMAPILKQLKKEYTGRAVVEFIDVLENPAAGREYGVRVMPTQVFYDCEGNEVWRHEGGMTKEEIEAKLKEMGA